MSDTGQNKLFNFSSILFKIKHFNDRRKIHCGREENVYNMYNVPGNTANISP